MIGCTSSRGSGARLWWGFGIGFAAIAGWVVGSATGLMTHSRLALVFVAVALLGFVAARKHRLLAAAIAVPTLPFGLFLAGPASALVPFGLATIFTAIAAAALWRGGRRLSGQERPMSLLPHRMLVLAAFPIGILVSLQMLVTPYPAATLRRALELAAAALVVFGVSRSTDVVLHRLVHSLERFGIVVAFFAVVQYVVGHPLVIGRWLDDTARKELFIAAGTFRASGPYVHPNTLALTLTLLIAISLAYRRRVSWHPIVICMGVLVSLSRAGAISSGLMILVVLLSDRQGSRHRRRALAVLVALGIGLAGIALASFTVPDLAPALLRTSEALQVRDQEAGNARISSMILLWRIGLESPAIGHGIGTGLHLAVDNAWYLGAHNTWVDSFAGGGVALLGFLAALIAWSLAVLRRSGSLTPTGAGPYIVVVLIYSQVETLLQGIYPAMIAIVVLIACRPLGRHSAPRLAV